MSFNTALCCPLTDCIPDICPRPCIDVCNELCISSCGDSTAVVYASPVVVRFPGPTLATCPQDSIVGTAIPNLPYRPGGVNGSGGGVSGSLGTDSSFGGGSGGDVEVGYGGSCGGGFGGGYGGFSGYGGSFGYGGRSRRSISIYGRGYSGYGGGN